MKTGTHIAYDGYLQAISAVTESAPRDAMFVARGRLVTPKGSYVDAPYADLYRVPGTGWIAVAPRPPRDN